MAKLIGTAGHVDHGKTTLIRALTGIDADRLPEERKRGLTIDIGFAYIDLPEHGRVSIVDVPGHERFVTNMLVGAMGVDVVTLCVAADQGVMPQTVEHFQVLRLLPTSQMVVALTRRDLADDEMVELVKIQVDELLHGTKFQGSPVVEVSAQSGLGIDRLKEEITAALSAQSVEKSGPWYIPIDRVFTRTGHGTVVTGTLSRGSVKVGEPCEVLPLGEKTKVRSLHLHGQTVESAVAGQRTAVNIAGIELTDVERGHVVCQPGSCFVTEIFDASVDWIQKPRHSARIRVSIGSDEVIAKAFLSDEEPNIVQVRCERPVVVAKGQCLVIRQYSPPHVLGGGKVLVPHAVKRKKSAVLGIADGGSLVSTIASQPHGIATHELGRVLGLGNDELATALERAKEDGGALSFAGLWMTPETYRDAADRFLQALRKIHESKPSLAAVQRDLVVKNMGATWSGKPLDRIVSKMSSEGEVVAQGTALRLPTHRPILPERQRALLDRLLDLLVQAGINTPNPVEFGDLLRVPPQAAQEIVRIGIEAGELVRLDDAVIYPVRFIKTLPDQLVKIFGDSRFTAADFRGRFETTRKYAIPILEYFDSINVTLRQGDERVIVNKTGQPPR